MVLTHFNESGDAHMVDVGAKDATHRIARAEGYISMQPSTLELIVSKDIKKGDVLGVAQLAGIMAAKRTADIVPLCHPLLLNHVSVTLTPELDKQRVYGLAQVETLGRTGVEMEALMAVQAALLTVYDMCKAVDRGMVIEQVRLLEKMGGHSGHWKRND